MLKGQKAVVVYYSLDGNTRFVARELARLYGADLLEVEPQKEIPQAEPLKHLWGGKQVIMKERPLLKNYQMEISGYDRFFIGTPVWAFNFAPPIRTFLEENSLQEKEVVLFCTHEGVPGRTLANLEKALSGNRVVGRLQFDKVLKNQEQVVETLYRFLQTEEGSL